MSIGPLQLFLRSRMLAARRRWEILTGGEFDPYPARPEGLFFSPSQRADALADKAQLKLDWNRVGSSDIETWQVAAREKLRVLLGVPKTILPAEILSGSELPVARGYERRRLYVRFGSGCDAPIDIVNRAGTGSKNLAETPVVICMQGTNSGAHLNLGEVRMPADVYKVANGSALALQAADNGYIAVSLERACFGERHESHLAKRSASPTVDAAFQALMLGETLLGQTVIELEALRQWIARDIAPGAPIYIAGYSAAGTAAIAASAAFPQFSGIAVGGCVGMFRDTLLQRGASGYNDIPDVFQWFEFDALLALIAPRPCLVIAGEKDHIWPYSVGEPVVASARRAWKEQNAESRLKLVRAPHGHTYYPELMWPAMEQITTAEGPHLM
jgi:hypothetical protein